jgi:hypothetical protein
MTTAEQEEKRLQKLHATLGNTKGLLQWRRELSEHDMTPKNNSVYSLLMENVREALRQYYFADEIEAGLL